MSELGWAPLWAVFQLYQHGMWIWCGMKTPSDARLRNLRMWWNPQGDDKPCNIIRANRGSNQAFRALAHLRYATMPYPNLSFLWGHLFRQYLPRKTQGRIHLQLILMETYWYTFSYVILVARKVCNNVEIHPRMSVSRLMTWTKNRVTSLWLNVGETEKGQFTSA